MIFLTLLIILIFSVSSISAQSIDDIEENNLKDNKVLKSSESTAKLSASATSKNTTKTNTKTTNTTKTTAKQNTTKTNTKAANTTKTTKTTTKTTNATKENKTTVNLKTLTKTSSNFINYTEKNGKFPKVKISNKNYTDTEYLYLISKAVENSSKSKIEIKKNLVKPYTNTNSKAIKGTLNKSEYVKLAGKTRKFIEKNQRAPNWVSSSKGKIPFKQVILVYSKCLDYYNKNNKLPSSVKLDGLDLDSIKNKINQKSNKTVKTTNTTKTNKTTSKTSNSTKKTSNTTKTTNKTSKTGSTSKTNTTKVTKNNNTTINNSNNNISLIQISINYVNNLLNNILDRLDPSKYVLDVSTTDEGALKLNTSKVNVDLNGKSSVNVKLSANNSKTSKNSAKTSTTTKKTTSKTTNATKASTKTTAKTNKTTTKKTTSASKNKSTSNKSVLSSLKKYLNQTKNCQVNNKLIKELTKKLTSSSKTEYQKANKVFQWVRDNIGYSKYSNTRKGAVKTLKSKYGNCVDQTHLLIALSRAAGVPARYVNGGNCKFTTGYVGGHVWAQMYIGKKWVVADTTSTRNTLGKIRNWNTKNYKFLGTYSAINF